MLRFTSRNCFSTSAVSWARRRRPVQTSDSPNAVKEENLLQMPDFSSYTTQQLFDLEDVPEFTDQDTSGAGHRQLLLERQALHYLRLIDGEMQRLQGDRCLLQVFSTIKAFYSIQANI